MQSINSRIILLLLSVAYGLLTAWYCQEFSRDYFNIQKSIEFTLNSYSPSFFLALYHFKGNTVLLLIFDFLRLKPSVSVYILYSVAASLRFWFSFKYLNFWDAFTVMLAFYWMLDWNQARFSLVFFLSYMLSRRVRYFLPVFHFMAGIKVLLERLTVRMSLLSSFVLILFITFYGGKIVDFWGRYFLGSSDAFPLYFFPYLFFVLFFFIFQGRSFLLKYGAMLVSLAYAFGFFVLNGMSAVYLGRFIEFFLLLSSYEFFLSKRRRDYRTYLGRLMLIMIGVYQSITVSGNVWRFLP